MASSQRPTYHQDYIARIRYSNALPPPPCPPKLLDIPNTGLSSGQYTSAGFASRLAREQPLNIEADAELGMPIDLVGIPGVFDGDESAIQPVHNALHLDAKDRALLRPPNALGKAPANASGVSFLRKTEYITSMTTGGSKFESSNSSNTMRIRGKRRRQLDVSEDDPAHILKQIVKGFNLAYPKDANRWPENIRGAEITSEERQAWRAPQHPTTKGLQVVDSYPLLPDWDATPDTGNYMMYKFMAAPVNNSSNSSYDMRLDVALLRPSGQTIEDQEHYLHDHEAHKSDPTKPRPLPRYQFEFFLPTSRDKVAGIKRNFSTFDPDNEAEIPFDHDDTEPNRKFFKYENIRVYETATQVGDPDDTFNDVVALALHDPESHEEERLREAELQKAAYFYPISQKTSIRPRRPGKVELIGEEQQRVDVIETAARDPGIEASKREEFRRRYDVLGE
ncbi:Paf1-domain-containing protein [Lojkania enalia]|uniref:Paf1-domain-containing protein n=1 Tax=Lojkania enalia TaxID=147567 RepID=A0A9P4N4V7_9PLEO|nr:Paf1-domain-containing protein [Didymosphaeria enalia]